MKKRKAKGALSEEEEGGLSKKVQSTVQRAVSRGKTSVVRSLLLSSFCCRWGRS